jgi:hypothetical protein
MQTHTSPLILTLELDPVLFAVLNDLRRAHFPSERNLIPAHVTLFHALPGAAIMHIRSDLTALAACTAPFPITLPSVRFLGRGVALEVVSPELSALRRDLAHRWKDWLSAQDSQGYCPIRIRLRKTGSPRFGTMFVNHDEHVQGASRCPAYRRLPRPCKPS